MYQRAEDEELEANVKVSINTSLAANPTFGRAPMTSARGSEHDYRAGGKEMGKRELPTRKHLS